MAGLEGSLANHTQTYLDILSRFTHLRHLALPSASGLSLGFEGYGMCGNAYFGKQGREHGRRTAKRSTETIEEAGRLTMEALPHLETLFVSGYKANIAREDGAVVLSWPWTGRLDEWGL